MVDKINKEDAIKLNTWVIKKLDELSWSMRKLGRRAGIDISVISKVLSGKLEKDISFYFLLSYTLNAIPEMLQVAGLVSKDELFLLHTMTQLTDKEKEEVFKFFDYLTHKREVVTD